MNAQHNECHPNEPIWQTRSTSPSIGASAFPSPAQRGKVPTGGRGRSSRRNATRRHPVTSTMLGALLATLLASSASAQQEVRHVPFEAHAQVHASSPNQAMETTTRAPSDMAILRNKQPMTVPTPPQQKTPKHTCPPGYGGTYPNCGRAPRQSPQHPSHTHYTDVSHAPSSTFKPATHKPPHVYTAKQRSLHAPTGPGPMHAGTGAANNANSHSINFVGGRAQPLQPGVKQSLNPQPIPPGHAVRHPSPPGAPIQRIGH